MPDNWLDLTPPPTVGHPQLDDLAQLIYAADEDAERMRRAIELYTVIRDLRVVGTLPRHAQPLFDWLARDLFKINLEGT
jgi:hypothetical protein